MCQPAAAAVSIRPAGQYLQFIFHLSTYLRDLLDR